MTDPAIEANFQLSFEQRQRTQNIEDWCCEYPDEAAHLIIGYADRLAQAEALLHRIDQRGYVGDQDHEDIQRLLSGAGPTRDNRRWFGRDGSKWEGE